MRNPYETQTFTNDEDWRDRAACKGRNTDLFFRKPGTPEADAALLMCGTCPVRNQCLQDALSYEPQEDLGIRGGMTEGARRKLRKGQAA